MYGAALQNEIRLFGQVEQRDVESYVLYYQFAQEKVVFVVLQPTHVQILDHHRQDLLTLVLENQLTVLDSQLVVQER